MFCSKYTQLVYKIQKHNFYLFVAFFTYRLNVDDFDELNALHSTVARPLGAFKRYR